MVFEEARLRIDRPDILPLRAVSPVVGPSVKSGQIASSIKEVKIIEPPVGVRDLIDPDKFLLLDGNIRTDILKWQGVTHVVCLVATEDEACTYNKRVSRFAIIPEHKMILKAIERGVPEERLARALNVDISRIRHKRTLLVGICSEVVELLQDKHVPIDTIGHLKKLKAVRQIEVVELMIAMNKYTISYAASLVAATPPAQLVQPRKPPKGLTDVLLGMAERKSVNLERDFKTIEQDYGTDHLELVVTVGYVGHLLANARVVRYLARTRLTS